MEQPYNTHSRYISYRDGSLFVENVPVTAITEEFQTPAYIYSSQHLIDCYHGYQKGLEGIPHLIAFAVKANGNLTLMNLIAKEGAGADLTSGGEMHLALRSGIPADRMVFSGVGKTSQEIKEALEAGILMFNVESEPELRLIAEIASSLNKVAPISIRVNPNIDAKTHPKISTGMKEHKFGLLWEQASSLYTEAKNLDSVELKGISAHIGSSLADTSPLLEALDRLLAFKAELESDGITIDYLDLGGGLGIQYHQENPDTPEEYTQKIRAKMQDQNCTLILEPGRSLVGNAGILVSKVSYVKRTPDKTFVVVDAGMNDLARPAIYGAHHTLLPVETTGDKTEKVDVVGPVCESSDVFGKDKTLPVFNPGDLIAMASAGAYGFSMASQYNGRVRPAEIMVKDGSAILIRKRENLDELWRLQSFNPDN